MRGTGEGTRAGPTDGRGSRGCLAASVGVGPRRSGRGGCCCSSFPMRRRLPPGLREAGAEKVPSGWRGGGGGTRPCCRCPGSEGPAGRPGTLTRPPAPHGQLRGSAASPAPRLGRSAMSDPERVLCERAGPTHISLGVGDVGTSRGWEDAGSEGPPGRCTMHRFCLARLGGGPSPVTSWRARFGSFASFQRWMRRPRGRCVRRQVHL